MNQQQHFDDLAQQWWDPKGPMKALHWLNPLRLAFIRQHCELASAQVLDIGCGAGLLSAALAAEGAQVTGLDTALQVLEVARQHDGLSRYVGQDLHAFAAAEPEARFDVICCMEMLEHTAAPEAVVQAAAGLLKRGGWAFFSTLNRSPQALIGGIWLAERVLRWAPPGTHRFAQFIRPSELARSLASAGLETVSLEGFSYRPWRGFERSQDLSINYILAARA